MRKLNERLGEAGGRGREAARSLGGLGRAALEAADAHEALRQRVEATFDATVESARAAAREQAEAGESWIDGVRGALERLRDELLNGEIFYTLKEAQVLIESWRCHYNAIRPHGSLGYRPPAPETIVMPSWPPGSATLRRPPSLAEEPGNFSLTRSYQAFRRRSGPETRPAR